MSNRKLTGELRSYWEDKVFKSHSDKNKDVYSFVGKSGKFYVSNMLTFIKEDEFAPMDYVVWERVLSLIPLTDNPIESGGLYMSYENFKDICGRTRFQKSKKLFVDLKLLLPVESSKRYFILNRLYACKIKNVIIKNEE